MTSVSVLISSVCSRFVRCCREKGTKRGGLQPDGRTRFDGVTERTHSFTAAPSVLGLHQTAATGTSFLEREGFY